MAPSLLTYIQRSSIFRGAVGMVRRPKMAFSYYAPNLLRIARWTITSREWTNFTYALTETNYIYLAHTIAVVTGAPVERVCDYIDELRTDTVLAKYVEEKTLASHYQHESDPHCEFGRRVGWYAVARVIKPRTVIETGIDKGLGALALCAALKRNTEEGFPGRYFGTDINPEAGWLLGGEWQQFGEILYGDSIESLKGFARAIDLFVNDSDHSAEYERREYDVIAAKLSPTAVVLGDNAHVSNSLERFSSINGRSFLFFREQPKDHWYPGAGIGFSFYRSNAVLHAPFI